MSWQAAWARSLGGKVGPIAMDKMDNMDKIPKNVILSTMDKMDKMDKIPKNVILSTMDNMDKMDKTPLIGPFAPPKMNSVHIVHIVHASGSLKNVPVEVGESLQSEPPAGPDTRVICWTCVSYQDVVSDNPQPGICLLDNPPGGEGKWRYPGQRIDCPEYRQRPDADEKARVSPLESMDLPGDDLGGCDGQCRSCLNPCTARTPSEQGKAVPGELPCRTCASLATCWKLLDGNVPLAELLTCSGTPGPAPPKAQYPNDQGAVKCSHCSNLDLQGATCRATGQTVTGIALSRECSRFVGAQK